MEGVPPLWRSNVILSGEPHTIVILVICWNMTGPKLSPTFFVAYGSPEKESSA